MDKGYYITREREDGSGSRIYKQEEGPMPEVQVGADRKSVV